MARTPPWSDGAGGTGRPAPAAGRQRLRRRPRPAASTIPRRRCRSPGSPRRWPGWRPSTGVTVALVSGRGVDDLQPTSGLTGPFRWIGSHGAELDGPLSAPSWPPAATSWPPRLAPAGRGDPGGAAGGQAGQRRGPRPAGRPTAPRPRRCWLAARTAGDPSLTKKPGKDVLELAVTDADKGSAAAPAARASSVPPARSTSATTSPTRTPSGPSAPDDVTVKVGDGDTAARLPGRRPRRRARRPAAGWPTCSADRPRACRGRAPGDRPRPADVAARTGRHGPGCRPAPHAVPHQRGHRSAEWSRSSADEWSAHGSRST